jgi:GT2 family glycosyltransferase
MTMKKSGFVSIIIVNYNGFPFTRQCLESLFRFHNPDTIEVIVVDNNSSDGSQTELPKLFPSINFIAFTENRGFGAANNAGAKSANGEFLFFLNNDTLFFEETIGKLKELLFFKKNYGIVGPKLLYEDNTFQISFGNYPTISKEIGAKKIAKNYSLESKEEVISDQPIEKDWVTGAALMIKRDLFEMVRGFDERYFMYFEDIDLCRRINKNDYKSIYVPSISLIHYGGKSYGKKDDYIISEYRRSQLRYYDKHNSFYQRTMLRLYMVFKYLPKLFVKSQNKLAMNILKLIISKHNLQLER